MIDLDVAVLLIAGAAFVGVGALFVAQLVESSRERRANAAKFAAQLQEWSAERAQRRAANAWRPATTGPTVRLACCAAPDVPDGAAHDKIGLGVKDAKEAYQKCRDWKLPLYQDLENA